MSEYGRWEIARFCVHCEEYLNRDVFFKNAPLCKHCGTKGKFGLPDVEERIRRKVYATGRRAAVEVARSKKGILPFLRYRAILLLRRCGAAERNYTWECKT